MTCNNCKNSTSSYCNECLPEQLVIKNHMTQTDEEIKKRIEEEFIEILEYGKNLTGEEVWTDLEKIQWLRKSMDTLQEEYKKELVEKIKEMIESEKWVLIEGKLAPFQKDLNKALDDIITNLTTKE